MPFGRESLAISFGLGILPSNHSWRLGVGFVVAENAPKSSGTNLMDKESAIFSNEGIFPLSSSEPATP